MNWQVVADSVLASLLVVGIGALVRLGREVSDLHARLQVWADGFSSRLADHQLLHDVTNGRLDALEKWSRKATS